MNFTRHTHTREQSMEAAPKRAKSENSMLVVKAKKTTGAMTEVQVDIAATVGDLATRLAEVEGCQASLVTVICRGAVLKDASMELRVAAATGVVDGKVDVVYMVRKAAAKASMPAAPKKAAPAASPGTAASKTASASGSSADPATNATAAPPEPGHRVLLLLRHGQCCHEGEHDERKALTSHGQKQADDSAQYIKALFDSGKLPGQRALLESTSRRARETAAKLILHMPEIDVWNGDLLRETDPTNNPMRAEDLFHKLFTPPPPGVNISK